MGHRAGVDGCGEQQNLLPTPVFSWDTAVTIPNSLLQLLVLDLSLINSYLVLQAMKMSFI
jgi:hypothetical protein